VACGSACCQGSNNFSNINETLQARLFSSVIRNYPLQYITPDMYWQMIEWQAWNEDINGDNRFPDNNEFFFNWNPTNHTLGRSGIHHDTLGSFNRVMYQDIAGLVPRMDNQVELWPIDVGLNHFAVNNLSYHGSDLTIVWQKPGGPTYYPTAPFGYSLYVNGQRAFTLDDLVHVTWQSSTGAVNLAVPGDTQVLFHGAAAILTADQVDLTGNTRLVDSLRKAGLDLTTSAANLAVGKTAAASFTTASPAAQATSPANAVDGFTISGLPVTSGAYVGTNPIWGDTGSPNSQDWLQIDWARRYRSGTSSSTSTTTSSSAPAATPTGHRRRTPCSSSTGRPGLTHPTRYGLRRYRPPTSTTLPSRRSRPGWSGCWSPGRPVSGSASRRSRCSIRHHSRKCGRARFSRAGREAMAAPRIATLRMARVTGGAMFHRCQDGLVTRPASVGPGWCPTTAPPDPGPDGLR
jgi:hypothetical protein